MKQDEPKTKTKLDGTPYASSTGKHNPIADQTNWRNKLQDKRIKFDDAKKAQYLINLLDYGQKILAAKAVDISYQTVVDHLDNDPDFEKAFDAAIDEYGAKMIKRIEKEALEGMPEIRYDKDHNIVYEGKKLESGLRAMILKRYDPMYRDKSELNINTKVGGVLMVPAPVTEEQWEKDQKVLNQKMIDKGYIDAEVISKETTDP